MTHTVEGCAKPRLYHLSICIGEVRRETWPTFLLRDSNASPYTHTTPQHHYPLPIHHTHTTTTSPHTHTHTLPPLLGECSHLEPHFLSSPTTQSDGATLLPGYWAFPRPGTSLLPRPSSSALHQHPFKGCVALSTHGSRGVTMPHHTLQCHLFLVLLGNCSRYQLPARLLFSAFFPSSVAHQVLRPLELCILLV